MTPSTSRVMSTIRQNSNTKNLGFGTPVTLYLARVLVVMLPLGALGFGARHLGESLFIPYLDPVYPYLYNGVVIVQGGTPGHYHHPGTSLQWLSGMVSLLTHFVRNNSSEFRADLASNSELYMTVSGFCLLLIFCVSLLALGIRILKHLGAIPTIVFLVGIGASFQMWYPQASLLSPESLVISSSLLIIASLMPSIACADNKASTLGMVGVGIALAIGATSKIILLPILVLILFLIPLRRAFVVFGSAVVAAALIMVPNFRQITEVWSWFRGVATTASRRGDKGDWRVVQNLIAAFKSIFENFSPYYLSFVCVIAIVLLVRTRSVKSATRDSKMTTQLRSRFGILLAIFTTLLMGYKPSSARDFVLLIALVPCAAAIVTRDLLDSLRLGNTSRGQRRVNVFTLAALINLLLLSSTQSVVRANTTAQQLDRQKSSWSVSQQRFAELESEAFVAYTYGTLSRSYAAFFANAWTGNKFDRELSYLFPRVMNFDIWSGIIRGSGPDSQMTVFDCEMLNSLLDTSRLFVVISPGIAANYLGERSAEGFVFGGDYLTIAGEQPIGEQGLIQIEIGECLP